MHDFTWDDTIALPSGGELRTNGPEAADATVLLVGGGTAAPVPGRWSTSMTWLAPKVRRAVGSNVRVVQVRYANTSWNRLDLGIADVAAALAHERNREVPPRRIVLVALSMGGATCAANLAGDDIVGFVAMAPWFPDQIPIEAIGRRRLLVVHGSLDNRLPLVPGTSLRASRRAVERAAAVGADAEWVGIPGGLHGLAVRWNDRIVTLPRARAYTRVMLPEIARLTADDERVRTR
ncbi:MAG: hypothetical protein JWM86_608 [Thermoleophilia bacterium]|nr:hypothetical protein [Thermoleophilia bacterium]